MKLSQSATKSLGFLLLAIGCFLAISLFICGFARASSGRHDIIVTGTASIEGNDLATARQQALQAAFRNALEQVLGVQVVASTVVENATVKSDEVHAYTYGLIQSYTLLSESRKNNMIIVTVRVFIEPGLSRLTSTGRDPLLTRPPRLLWRKAALLSDRSWLATAGGILYYTNPRETLAAVAASSGQNRWVFPRLSAHPDSLVIDKLLVTPELSGNLVARDLRTGWRRWTYQTGGPIDIGPLRINDHTIAIGHSYRVEVIDATQGQRLWGVELWGDLASNAAGFKSSESDAIGIQRKALPNKCPEKIQGIAGNPYYLFILSSAGSLQARELLSGRLRWTGSVPVNNQTRIEASDGFVFTLVPTGNELLVRAMAADSGKVKWEIKTRFPELGRITRLRAAGNNNRLAIAVSGHISGTVVALDAVSGTEIMRTTTADPINVSPIIRENQLVITTIKEVRIFDILGRVPERRIRVDSLISRSPILADDKLFIMTHGSLLAYGL